MAQLNEFFQDHLISKGRCGQQEFRLDTTWFSLWSLLKNRVFLTEPADMEELKSRISQEIQSIEVSKLLPYAGYLEIWLNVLAHVSK